MSSERQRLANQQNARRSTGPKTIEGKENSRRNALKHGLTGSGKVLTRSDDRKFRKTLKDWRAHLQPIDVLEDCLVSRAVLAEVRLKRCLKKDLADLSRRKQRATKRWDVRQEEAVNEHVILLATEPERAVIQLESNGVGCDWLIDRWRRLAAALEEPGFWDAGQAATAIQMLGKDPETTPMDDSSIAKLRLAILAISPDLDPDQADAFFEESTADLDPKARFEALCARLPDPETGRTMLLDIIEEEMARLEPMSQQLWDDLDGPDRQEAEDRSLVDTSPEGARALRYESASEMSLHRNMNLLIRLRKVESEQQTYTRLSKMGINQGRRFNGTNWEIVRDEAKAQEREEAERRDHERNAKELAYRQGLVAPPPVPRSMSQEEYEAHLRKRAEERAAAGAGSGGSDAPADRSASAEAPLRNEANFSDVTQKATKDSDASEHRSPSHQNDGGSEAAKPAGSGVGSPHPARAWAGEHEVVNAEAPERLRTAPAASESSLRNEANSIEPTTYANVVCGDPEAGSPAANDGLSTRTHSDSGQPQAPCPSSATTR